MTRIKVMNEKKRVRYVGTWIIIYVDPHANNVAYESCDRKDSFIIQNMYCCVVTDGTYIKICEIQDLIEINSTKPVNKNNFNLLG